MVFYFVLFNLVLWICVSAYLLVNTYKIAQLADAPLAKHLPSLAVVIAVRDEEEHLRDALTSVCELNYPQLQIIVVNDRSTDGTAGILQECRALYPNLCIEEISSLPPMWLGKTHALHRGASLASSEWILFTDADILFHPDALKKALGYAEANRLDHLTVLPEVNSRSKLLNAVLATFQIMLEIKLRPWLAKSKKSSASIGVGAFNLIRRRVYEQIGGHETIKLRPDDDLQFGRVIKHSGFKQDVLYGQGQISLEWYTSIKEFVNGLMKNTFSAFNYQLLNALSAAFAAFIIFAVPVPLGLLSGNLSAQLIALALIAVQFVLFYTRNGNDTKWWYSLTIPYAGLLMSYITLRATFLTLKNKGLSWRGTFYSLKELRQQDNFR